MNFCKHCGDKLNTQEKFCANCGQAISDQPEPIVNHHADGTEQVTNTATTVQYAAPDPSLQATSGTKRRKKFNRKLPLFLALAIVVIAAVAFYMIKDTPHESKVDGVSDEVYYQLVEHYFYMETFMGLTENKGLQAAINWSKEQEQYDEAKAYADEVGDGADPMQVLPNPLLFEYGNPGYEDAFNLAESNYIIKFLKLRGAMYRQDEENYHNISAELKKELKIKDKYNPF